MKMLKGLSIQVLLGVLLMVAVVGVASATPSARPQEQAWRVLAVPPHACIPQDRYQDFQFVSDALRCATGNCDFVCEVDFPAAGEQAVGAVNVKRVTMYAYDNSLPVLEFWFRKIHPPSAGDVIMAHGMSIDVATDPQAVVDYTIQGNPIYRVQPPYLWVYNGGWPLRLYGFFIHYTW